MSDCGPRRPTAQLKFSALFGNGGYATSRLPPSLLPSLGQARVHTQSPGKLAESVYTRL
jgi:hypothetical protein